MAAQEKYFVECINVMLSWITLLLMKLWPLLVLLLARTVKKFKYPRITQGLICIEREQPKFNKKLHYCLILNQMQYLWVKETANLTKGNCCRANIWWQTNVMGCSHNNCFYFHLPDRLFWWSTISYGWRRRVMRWNWNGKGSYSSSEYQQ